MSMRRVAGDGPAEQQIRIRLTRMLAHRAPGFRGPLDEETSLVEGGLCLDSLALMDLIGDIEETFEVNVPLEHITAEHFGSVGRLVRYLLDRGAKARPGLLDWR